MKKIFSVFGLDIKSMSKNIIIFVVVIGITILPALYAWFNIASNWDPYSNTGELAFAVCSLDKGYTFKDMTINAGDKLKENLKGNDKMGWSIVDSEDEATEGVENGKYYAAIVIPENFSENLLSITNGKFKQAKMQYYVNEKENAIAPKITDKGVQAIQETIDQTYVSTVAEAIATALNITSSEIEENKETLAEKVMTALQTAKGDIGSLNSSIDLLITTLDSVDSVLKSNEAMAPSIQKALSNAGVLTGDVKGMLSSAKSTSAQLTGVIENLIASGDTYMESVSAQLDEAFGTASADANAIASKLSKIEVINQKKIELNNKLVSVLETIQSTLGVDCSKVIAKLNSSTEKQNAIIDKIESICSAIKTTGSAPANAKAELESLIADANNALASVGSEFSAIKQNIDNKLTASFDKLDGIADFAQTVSLTTDQLTSAFESGSDSVKSLKEVLVNLKNYLTNLTTRIDKAVERVNTLKDSDTLENMLLPIIQNPKELGEFLSSPVGYETNRVYPIENYGSAMTPFYSSLALWVGGVVLVAVLNVDLSEKDRKKLGKANSTQLFFGRYIVFFILGQVQALIIALGDLFFLKIQCVNPLLFILTCLISSFVYTLIIYSLTITFSVIGKALAVIILVIQIAGAGGTFPIEVLPAPFKAIAPFLPFKYGVNALRETVAGVRVEGYLQNLGMFLLFIIPALVLGLLLRKPCIKAIKFFNEKIEESDLVI